ncbi:MAG TPA: glutathione transferase GstA [Hyphomicrobiaceae bacterium]|jgi:glutathione S-transferase|nr:glutathione transferase GstA [Hyphomicrobiaceae bacterium]
MKLYYSPGACSLSPHIVLNEAGLPFEKIKADTKTKVLPDGSDYRSVNPLGYVPLLELDDGTRITEGPAIVQYIADQVPAKKLAPPNGTMERVKLQTWLNFVTSELHKGFSPLFNPSMPDEAKKIFRERLGTRFAYLDKHLASNDYLMGKDFSVADAYAFVVSNWAGRVDVDLSSHANVLAWRKRVGARPAVQAAMKAEGLIK